MRLENKVAVVVGGASGMGEAIGHLFAREGATVVIADSAKIHKVRRRSASLYLSVSVVSARGLNPQFPF